MKLTDDEREVLLAEIGQALDQVRSPQMQAVYGELLSAVDRSEVPDDLQEPLQNLLEIGLESGRIRKVHQADGETAALRVYRRTPRGRAIQASADAVNQALQALQGHTLEQLNVSPHGPGAYSISAVTDQGTLLVRVDRHGVRLHSVEVG